MFLSNNSSSSSSSNIRDHNQQQQPMFDKPSFLINDVSPNNSFKPYHHHPSLPSPPHDLHPSFFHFSPTFVDHICYEDDVGFLQQQDLFLMSSNSHQFITQQQQPLLLTTPNDTSTTTTTTTITPSQTLPETALNNVAVALKTDKSKMIINNNIDAGGVSAHFKANNNKKSSWNNKRCSLPMTKKDRHTKIVTAQGPRDRRMRLSLKVARPFFTLQDMLGFDKASKTVEWLMMNCKLEINELKRRRLLSSEATATATTKLSCSGGSYTSECEVLSEIDTTTEVQEQGNGNKQKEKRVRGSRKLPTFRPLAKETRAKARARARERTIGKMWSRSLPTTQHHPEGSNHLPNNCNLNQLRAATSLFEFETGDESGSQSQDMKSSLEVVAEVEEPSSHSLEESIVINSNSCSSHQIFNYQQEIESSQGLNLNNTNNSSSFTENWDMDDASANSSFCATSTNINHLSTGNVNDPISSPFRLTTSDARLPSQFIDFQFFE